MVYHKYLTSGISGPDRRSDRLLDQAMQLPNTEATMELLLESAKKVWEGPHIGILDHLSESMLQRLGDALKYEGWHN